MSEFDHDKAQLISDLKSSRDELLEVVSGLTPADFGQARRGSWTVARILEHVLHSERLYTQLISAFSGESVALPEVVTIAEADSAAPALDASRSTFLSAVDGVREDDFYRLQTIGHEEYSVLSILENNAAHDREHAEQIRKTIGAVR
jgi:uncharacterized damage-inducible protein DinB